MKAKNPYTPGTPRWRHYDAQQRLHKVGPYAPDRDASAPGLPAAAKPATGPIPMHGVRIKRLKRAGIYDGLPAEVYHADPAPEPSLSRSTAKTALQRSWRHAWHSHPRLNPDAAATRRQDFDLGQAAHAALFRSGEAVEVIDADSYRTAAAKEARDRAYAQHRIPLLPHQHAAVTAMVEAAREQLHQIAEARDCGVADGTGIAERTLIWQEPDQTWMRARADWMTADGAVIVDYKTTAGSAHPDPWSNSVAFDTGCDLQPPFYGRGVKALMGVERPAFRFIVQETEPPYALSWVGLSEYAMAQAETQVARAIEGWRRCRATGIWPGYPGVTCFIDPPARHDRRRGEQAEREQALRDQGVDPFKLMIEWQAPQRAA